MFLSGEGAPQSPRIFRKRVRRVEAGVRPGEVVAVRTGDGRFIGRGFYSPRSVIAVRVLDREEGGPPVDAAWFRARIHAADRRRRETLRLPEVTDAWRVVSSEGDGISGLVVDRYADLAVVEVGARGVFENLDAIDAAVRSLPGIRRVVVRADPRIEEIEGFRAQDRHGDDATAVIREHGLAFRVDARHGHKTGFFLDQRDARARTMALAPGRAVLDLCCYTGGFALAAARGGAVSVVGVDLDEKALEIAGQNARLNALDLPFVHRDAFDYLREGPRADLVILDPPKLAATRRSLPVATRKSVDMNTLAIEAVAPGGLLFTFSCTGLFSAGDLERHLATAARRARRRIRVLERTTQPPDHPVAPDFPEGRYLNGLLLEVE